MLERCGVYTRSLHNSPCYIIVLGTFTNLSVGCTPNSVALPLLTPSKDTLTEERSHTPWVILLIMLSITFLWLIYIHNIDTYACTPQRYTTYQCSPTCLPLELFRELLYTPYIHTPNTRTSTVRTSLTRDIVHYDVWRSWADLCIYALPGSPVWT